MFSEKEKPLHGRLSGTFSEWSIIRHSERITGKQEGTELLHVCQQSATEPRLLILTSFFRAPRWRSHVSSTPEGC